jgi:phosphatidylethanolamine/phosphatidyl-N-methylethanolamine N-methyltransferase
MEKINFYKQFKKDRKMIGAMRPSSRFLTNKMLKNIPFKKALNLVELGSGTGVFTKEILKRMSADSKLLVFELNDTFYERLKLKITDPRVILIHDSAENLGLHLEKYGISKADIIISSLPLANFSINLRKKIIRSAKKGLKKGGRFIQFQYSLQAKTFLNREFKTVRIHFELLNIPPAFIYNCKK